MNTTPRNLAEVRDIVAYLWARALDNPAEAVEVAAKRLRQVDHLEPCARAELLVMRAAGHRQTGNVDACEDDLDSAETACTCAECRPRIMRQRALLAMMQSRHRSARRLIDRALVSCAMSGPVDLIPHLHLTRGLILHLAGDLAKSLISGRVAQRSITPKDGFHFLVLTQRLAVFLMSSGNPDHWTEAWNLLSDSNLRTISGGKVIRLHLRWVRALVGVEVGKISIDSARHRIGLLHDEFRALGHLDTVALTSDAALLGGSKISKAAAEALGLLPATVATEDIRGALVDLRSASEHGTDTRGPALRLRAMCQGAPPVPPSIAA